MTFSVNTAHPRSSLSGFRNPLRPGDPTHPTLGVVTELVRCSKYLFCVWFPLSSERTCVTKYSAQAPNCCFIVVALFKSATTLKIQITSDFLQLSGSFSKKEKTRHTATEPSHFSLHLSHPAQSTIMVTHCATKERLG